MMMIRPRRVAAYLNPHVERSAKRRCRSVLVVLRTPAPAHVKR